MKKYIVAVSGGVDSVVLLDMLIKAQVRPHTLLVAHFDHGIRPDSHEDERFVASLAERHGVAYESKREQLGTQASEALARERRYMFLRALASNHKATIVTAHHLDDLVETVAINLRRGTGWRGLAVLDSDVLRPLIDTPKQSLLKYAHANNLTWREDSTNDSDVYLRNRIRKQATDISHDTKRQLRALHDRQKEIKKEIENETMQIIGGGPEYSRYLLITLPHAAALECLRFITEGVLTRPQLKRSLLAIKTAPKGSTYEAGAGIKFRFSTRQFSL
jgi:tRNA(Ile)-lysidine synthase